MYCTLYGDVYIMEWNGMKCNADATLFGNSGNGSNELWWNFVYLFCISKFRINALANVIFAVRFIDQMEGSMDPDVAI